MDAGLAAIAGALVGGLIGFVGGSIERHWADKRRWDADRKGAYIQLLTQPLVLLWDLNVMLERKRRPRDRNLPPFAELERRMRSIVIDIGHAFGEVSSLASAEIIRAANQILQSSMRLVELATSDGSTAEIEAASDQLSRDRLEFVEEVRRALGAKGASGLPIEADG